MNGNFTPLTRCPGIHGTPCECLIDTTSRTHCNSCRGLMKDEEKGRARTFQKMPREARPRGSDSRSSVPPAGGVRSPSPTQPEVTTSIQTTNTKGGPR